MGLSLLAPLRKWIVTSKYGYRIAPAGKYKGSRRFHNGLDMAAPKGTPVYAAAAGVVSSTWEKHPINGNAARINHVDPSNVITATTYLHLDTLGVRKGDLIRTGQQIGTVGSTGQSTGPHLHFMITGPSGTLDPQLFITPGGGTGPSASQGTLALPVPVQSAWTWLAAGAGVALVLGIARVALHSSESVVH